MLVYGSVVFGGFGIWGAIFLLSLMPIGVIILLYVNDFHRKRYKKKHGHYPKNTDFL